MKRTIGLLAAVVAAMFGSQTLVMAADTCSCDAHFEARFDLRGPHDFKPDIPAAHFTALKDRGALQTANNCRREARDQGQACMDHIWRNRWHPENEPSQCSTSTGIRGDVPYDIKPRLERAVCGGQSPLVGFHDVTVKVYRRTVGGHGCGSVLDQALSVFVSNYRVDCLAIRDQQRLGFVAETRVSGIDRPGSDLPGSGIAVGNGTADACQAACKLRGDCKAWTWVPPGVQGPGSRCWLKGSVPWSVPAPGMISGTRAHTST